MQFVSTILMLLSISYACTVEAEINLFIQLVTDSEMLRGFRTETTYVINNIVKEELEKIGLEKNYFFDFFDPKPVQRLSLYYFYRVDITKKEDLLLKIEEISKKIVPQEVIIKAEVNFFGDLGNELVMLIEGKGLADLNGKFKDMADRMSQGSKKPFYDIDKSKRFDFLPHTGIGVLRLNRITDHVRQLKPNDDALIAKIVSSITERIKKIVAGRIANLSLEKRTMVFKTLGIFDPQLRKPQDPSCTGYLREFTLGS